MDKTNKQPRNVAGSKQRKERRASLLKDSDEAERIAEVTGSKTRISPGTGSKLKLASSTSKLRLPKLNLAGSPTVAPDPDLDNGIPLPSKTPTVSSLMTLKDIKRPWETPHQSTSKAHKAKSPEESDFEFYLHNPKHDHNRVIELTKTKASDMFAGHSRLSVGVKHMLFHKPVESEVTSDEDTRSLPSGNTSGPDESWLLDWSGEDSENEVELVEKEKNAELKSSNNYSQAFNAAFEPLFMAMLVCGRWPFGGGFNRRNAATEFSFSRKSWRFLLFGFTSLFLFFILATILVSSYSIFIKAGKGGDIDADAYLKLELLYLEKYLLQVSIFIAMLSFITVCNLVVLLRGEVVANWLNYVVHESNLHGADLTKWIWLYAMINLLAIPNYFIYMMVMYRTKTTPGVVGGTNAIAVILFHFFGRTRINFVVFPYLSIIVLVLQMYVLICARLCILLPMLCSILVRNMAVHRNLRIGLLLGKVKTKSEAVAKFRKTLTHKNVFEFHNSANSMLRSFCNQVFAYDIVSYYVIKCCVLCLCLIKIARTADISIFGGMYRPDFNDTAVKDQDGNVIETYIDRDGPTIFDAMVYLFVSFLGFSTVTGIFTDCSTTFLAGFDFLRPHNLMKTKSSQERCFILSLTQCFTSVNPYLVRPAALFAINRRFVVRIIEWSSFIFIMVVQIQASRFITEPIYGICTYADGTKQKCILAYAGGRKRSLGMATGSGNKADELLAEQAAALSVIPILQDQYKSQLKSFAPFAEYCPGTDVIRVFGFNAAYEKIPLPSDPMECIARPYKRDIAYYDAFGRKISEWDDCGFPRFPEKSSYLTNDISNPQYPNLKRISTSSSQEVNCWDFQPNDGIGILGVSPDLSEYVCGYPREYAELLCSAWAKNLSPEMTKERLLSMQAQRTEANFTAGHACTPEDFDQAKILEHTKNLTPKSKYFVTPYFYMELVQPPDDIQVKFIPFDAQGNPKQLRLFNYKHEWAPFTSISIANNCKPGLYFDCTGELLDEYDDAGFLPFSYYLKDGTLMKRPEKMVTTITFNGITRDLMCFETVWNEKTMRCGVLDNGQNFNRTVARHVYEWTSVLNSRNHLLRYN